MLIIGCDYHPGFQQIAFVDTETGEVQERRLKHRKKPRSSTVLWQEREPKCGWEWKQVGTHAGLSGC